MPLTQAQATALQALANNVELAYRQVQLSKTALSKLMAAGQATCNDIRTYNLVVRATYFYQKSMSDMIRANGAQAPSVGNPLYIAFKGIPGDQAVNIDCTTGQLKGWMPSGLGDFFVNPRDVEWRQEPTPGDAAAVQRVVSRAAAIPMPTSSELRGPLGVGPLDIVALIIIGIVIFVAGAIILKIVEAFTDVPQKAEETRQMAIAATAHRESLEKRAKCYDDCIAKGGKVEDCAKNCARLNPDFSPPSFGGGLGTVGMIFAGLTVLGVGILVVKAVRNRHRLSNSGGGGHHRALPAGHDDDDDYEDDDAIDAEYEEK